MLKLPLSSRILAAALALGLCVDLFFHGHAPGLSLPLFVLLLLAALFALGRAAGVPPARRNLWLVVPLLFLAGMVAVRASPLLTCLNLAATLALLVLVAHYYAAGRPERLGLLGYPLVAMRTAVNAVYRALPLLRESLPRRAEGGPRPWAWLRGALLALPVLAVFTLLLSSADLVFRRYVADLLRWRFWQELLGRGFVVLGAAWVLAGGLAYGLARGSEKEPGALDRGLGAVAGALRADAGGEDGLERLLAALGAVFSIGMVEAAMILGSVSLLFMAFAGIQFAYLFGGQANISAQGYTYAEYARRGFFELLVVAMLSLVLVLGLQWLTRRERAGERRAFGALGSALVGLVLVMLASAWARLRLYEQAYGFTEIRLYVYVFMGWLGVALVWLLVTLWRRGGRFAVGALGATLGFLITLNLLNPDAFVAGANLERYRATGKLDAAYLTTLSDDAVPVLIEALDDVKGPPRGVLVERLRQRLGDRARWQSWQSFNLARWQAGQLLVAEGCLQPGGQ